jgi:hypothetical protein
MCTLRIGPQLAKFWRLLRWMSWLCGASATLRCGFERVRFTDDGCFTVEVAADHDSKFPRASLPRSMSDGCPLFMSRWTARSSACSPCSFVIV